MASLLAAFTILSLYAETIFQVYVIMTSHAVPVFHVPIALTSLVMTITAFLTTSVASFVLALKSTEFNHKTRAKVIFGGLHVFNLGFLWRIFKLILCFSENELKQLAALRLVHVVMQSAPYVILYSRFFVNGDKINVIQAISLISSTVSSALALTSFSLRQKMTTESWEEKLPDHMSPCRAYASVAATLVGTVLVLATRLASISLMATQQDWWVVLPLAIHYVLLVLGTIFSTRNRAPTVRSCRCVFLSRFRVLGMSALNTLDLVNDNIDRVMCKYVGFYSLVLAENIVLLAFWLLNAELQYVTKLIAVVGILTAFIVGLIAKFVGCTLLQDIFIESTDAPSPSTSATTTVTAITTPRSFSEMPSQTFSDEDDLISIVQASILTHARHNSNAAPHTTSRSPNKSDSNKPTVEARGRNRELGISSTEASTNSSNLHNSTLHSRTTLSHISDSTLKTSDISTSLQHFLSHGLQHPEESLSDSRKPQGKLYDDISEATTQSNQTDPFKELHGYNATATHFLTCAHSQNDTDPDLIEMSYICTAADRPQTIRALKVPYGRPKANCCLYLSHSEPGGGDNSDKLCSCHRLRKHRDERVLGGKTPPHSPQTNVSSKHDNDSRGYVRPIRITYKTSKSKGTSDATLCNIIKDNHRELFNLRQQKAERLNSGSIRHNSSITNGHLKSYKRRNSSQNPTLGTTLSSARHDMRARIVSPTQLYFDQSESSFISATATQDMTSAESSHTSTEMTSQPIWEEDDQSTASWPLADRRIRRKPRLLLPSEASKIPSSENIIRWLADTEQCLHDINELQSQTDC